MLSHIDITRERQPDFAEREDCGRGDPRDGQRTHKGLRNPDREHAGRGRADGEDVKKGGRHNTVPASRPLLAVAILLFLRRTPNG